MKFFKFSFLIILSAYFLITSCSDYPTDITGNEKYVQNDLSKKPTGDKKTPSVKYTSTVLLSSTSFKIVPDYYQDKEPVSCYNYNYREKPDDIDNGEFISISVEAYSLNDKDWFNTIIVVLLKDDGNGQPDEDGEFLLFGKNFDYYQKFTQTPEPAEFFWWGQWRDLNPVNYSCQLKICEPGKYFLRVSLRQELKNKKGNFGVHQAVYSSVDDPNFQKFPGQAPLGYVPITVIEE
jgi:hypothetical protein